MHGGSLRCGRTRAGGGQLADTEVARSNHARGGGWEVAVRRRRRPRRWPIARGGGREAAGAEGRGRRQSRRRLGGQETAGTEGLELEVAGTVRRKECTGQVGHTTVSPSLYYFLPPPSLSPSLALYLSTATSPSLLPLRLPQSPSPPLLLIVSATF
jgi:hypothetical protein